MTGSCLSMLFRSFISTRSPALDMYSSFSASITISDVLPSIASKISFSTCGRCLCLSCLQDKKWFFLYFQWFAECFSFQILGWFIVNWLLLRKSKDHLYMVRFLLPVNTLTAARLSRMPPLCFISAESCLPCTRIFRLCRALRSLPGSLSSRTHR